MMIHRSARFFPLLAALVAILLLGVAHAVETFGHYPPCELCLKQRDIYWLIFWGGIALFFVARMRPALLRIACAVLACLFLAECAVAIYHAGVEWKWWPGPTSCTSAGVHAVSVADMSQLLSGKPQNIVQCDVAAFRILGLSMAGWNALIALKWTLVSLIYAAKAPAQ